MITVSKDDIKQARDLIANGTPEAVGYRLIIKPLDAVTGLEKSETEKYKTLAKAGFKTKTKDKAEQESRGTQHGVLVHAGPEAFKGALSENGPWVKEGDVVIFDRYAGVEMELPPGSGEKYRFTNDESILGRMA